MAIGQLASTGKQDGATPSSSKLYMNFLYTTINSQILNIQILSTKIISSVQDVDDIISTLSVVQPMQINAQTNQSTDEVTSATINNFTNGTFFSCFVNGTRIGAYLSNLTISYSHIEV